VVHVVSWELELQYEPLKEGRARQGGEIWWVATIKYRGD
jgi:hypothetical protein